MVSLDEAEGISMLIGRQEIIKEKTVASIKKKTTDRKCSNS
jgi:hypothetical protein